MTPEIWQTLVRAVGETPNCPSWLKRQAQLSWEAVSRLPVVEQTATGQDAVPTVEEKMVAPDYLDFLREQIDLGARGPKWSAVLRNRLTALEPFLGRELLVATFHCKPHSTTLRINPETKALVHGEIN
jgi:hypothetical protein